MLCTQGWQGRAQGIHSLVVLLTSACVLLASCIEGNRGVSEAELSEFGTYVNALDTSQMRECLEHILYADSSKWESDKTVKEYYANRRHDEIPAVWYSRMGVSSDADSLLSFLSRELQRNGLSDKAFYTHEIAEDLNIVRGLAFDSIGVSINEVLPRLDYHLSKAFVRYTTGQRHGFIRPGKILNRTDMKANSEGYARLFDYDIKAPDYQEAVKLMNTDDRMQYLLTSKPDSHVYLVLQNQLEKTADKDARHKLAVNMERCRWQIRQPGENERMILVNIPAQQLWAVCPDSVSRLSNVTFKRSSLRAVMITFAPILEHSMAVVLPIPDEAPVTKTVLPSNEYGLYDMDFICFFVRDLYKIRNDNIVCFKCYSTP